MFWRRSEDALTVAAGRFGAYCRRIAENILRSREDADECVNETWLKAWNAIPPAKPSVLRAFLGKITRNIALDRYNASRSQRRGGGEVELALDELGEIPAPHAGDSEITAAINGFLRDESPQNADIFVKRYWYVRSVKEIAAEYGFSENEVTSTLFRMRGRLRAKLESEGLM
jgi:RNA polymerase sigma-70 factor (ECF subfamily)